MAITFHCPAGHKLSSREELSGKTGHCPKCGAEFVVPPQVFHESGEDVLRPNREGERVAPDFEPERTSDERGPSSFRPTSMSTASAPGTVTFLCPNGHRLNAPNSLVGKAGQCPHCQARFLVPESHPDDPDDAGQLSTTLGDGNGQYAAVASADGATFELGHAGGGPSGALTLFSRLWALKLQQNASVEIHFPDGKLLIPERFSPALSNSTHGLFSEKEVNGTHRLTVVSWESISRVTIRGVQKLPAGVFEPA